MYFRECTFCHTKNVKFSSIEDSLGSVLKNYGFPYQLKDFETISYKRYQCPVCSSSDRDRLYKIYLDKFLDTSKEVKFLDFAPSKPLRKYLLKRKNIKYRSADLMMKNVDDQVDITDMKQYKDSSFDFFICSHIIEHVDSDVRAMQELYRILSPGGKGILMTPIIDKQGVYDEDISEEDVNERWRRFGQDDHVRLYQKDIFIKRVKEAKFDIQEFNYKRLGLWSIIKNGITLRSKLYIVEKR
jgi:SAM-dependent methyltransferase